MGPCYKGPYLFYYVDFFLSLVDNNINWTNVLEFIISTHGGFTYEILSGKH